MTFALSVLRSLVRPRARMSGYIYLSQQVLPRNMSSSTKETVPGKGSSEDFLSFPGAKVPFTSSLSFVNPSDRSIPCYRTMDETGSLIEGAEYEHMDEGLAKQMLTCMTKLQAMDTIFYEAQRQVRS